MKTTDGHLTRGNKTAIKAILNAGLTTGKVGRTTYQLTPKDNGSYFVAIFQKERHCIGADLAMTKNVASFSV